MNTKKAEAVLLETGRVLDSCGVPFYLILGTCLGVVRDGRIIAYDLDIDLGCLIEDIEGKCADIAAAFVATGFKARIVSNPLCFPRAIVVEKDGIKVDIAGYMKRGTSRYCPSSFLDYCLVYPAEFMETTEEVEYLGRKWRVPNPAKTYLARHYGRGWVTPDPKYHPSQGKSRIYGYMQQVKP